MQDTHLKVIHTRAEGDSSFLEQPWLSLVKESQWLVSSLEFLSYIKDTQRTPVSQRSPFPKKCRTCEPCGSKDMEWAQIASVVSDFGEVWGIFLNMSKGCNCLLQSNTETNVVVVKTSITSCGIFQTTNTGALGSTLLHLHSHVYQCPYVTVHFFKSFRAVWQRFIQVLFAIIVFYLSIWDTLVYQ